MKPSKETAQDVLSQYPQLPGRLGDYWRAVAEGELPTFYLQTFQSLRNEYSDDMPEVDVRTFPEIQGERICVYKCQTNYRVGLFGELQRAIEDEVITDGQIIQYIQDFLVSDMDFQVNDPGNEGRIEKIYDILELAIAEVSKLVTVS